MPRPAETRSRSRGSRSSQWLSNGLLVLSLWVAAVYCIWGEDPLKRTWDQLGFGKAPKATSIRSQRYASSEIPRVNVVQALELPDADSSNGGTSQSVHNTDEDSTAPQFLPRHRERTASSRREAFVEKAENAELDHRFDFDVLAEKPASISTTVFTESPNPDTQSIRSSRQTHGRSDRPTPKPHKPYPANRTVQPRTSSTAEPAQASRIQLTGGEDEETPTETIKPASRPRVKASPTTNTPGLARLDLNEVSGLIEQGRDAEAYHKLSDAYFQFPAQRTLFQAQLDDVAQRIYFSPQPQILPPYEIQPGDQLRKIAGKYQLSWQYLSRLNQVDAKKIRPGKLLKVFQGPFKAKIDLSDFQLIVTLNGQYVKSYLVGIGKMNTTPIGEFTVREKLENPTYFGPNGNVLAPDDPQNPLGERWIDIGNSFGIHGTIEPDSIGKSESAGCIRMRNDDVAEVYDLLVVGSTVRIQR